MNVTKIMRPIRSYVHRGRSLTPHQTTRWNTCWERFGVSLTEPIDHLSAWFGDLNTNLSCPYILEIGFGMGETFCQQLHQQRDTRFIGVEVHTPGVLRTLEFLEEHACEHVRLIHGDVHKALNYLPPHSLDGVQIYFPDPWHKKKHQKRRLIQPEFLSLLASRMKPNATLHLMTDWDDYAVHMLKTLQGHADFANASPHEFMPCALGRQHSKYHRRGLGRGHAIWELLFSRQ